METPVETATSHPAVIRRKGAIKLLGGLMGTALLVAGVVFAAARGFQFKSPFAMIPLAIPFVYFCIGSIETITGAPFRRTAEIWMGLKGWQRGILGTFIVLAAIVIVIVGLGLMFHLKIL